MDFLYRQNFSCWKLRMSHEHQMDVKYMLDTLNTLVCKLQCRLQTEVCRDRRSLSPNTRPCAHQREPAAWPGDGTLRNSRSWGLWIRRGTLVCLDCEGIKAQGFLCSGSLLRGTSSSCCYLVITPRLNYFKDLDMWDFVMWTLGLNWWGILVWMWVWGV